MNLKSANQNQSLNQKLRLDCVTQGNLLGKMSLVFVPTSWVSKIESE